MKNSNARYELDDCAVADLVAWFTKMAMVWEFAIDTVPKFFGPSGISVGSAAS
jgi:hypothetical protein